MFHQEHDQTLAPPPEVIEMMGKKVSCMPRLRELAAEGHQTCNIVQPRACLFYPFFTTPLEI